MVAALMLVDRGKVALDDPVSKYIPSFASMKVGVERQDLVGQDLVGEDPVRQDSAGKDAGAREDGGKRALDLVPLRRPITVEDLLLQTLSITYGFYGQGRIKAAYDGIYLGDFDNAEFAERIAKVPLAEQPRTLWDYCHSADILGRVVEVASGQSLYRFELDPLGMTTTKFFLTDPAERARYAAPLPRDRHVERNPLDVTRWESGGGGMFSTIADFARYGQMLLTAVRSTAGPISSLRRSPRWPAITSAREPASRAISTAIRATVSATATVSASAPPPGVQPPIPPGSLGEIKWDSASGVYIVVDRTEDMFFVVMQNSPSWRISVITTVKKIGYDAFEK
jgi:CubicO group peptidase (beta-lactamase class C family)